MKTKIIACICPLLACASAHAQTPAPERPVYDTSAPSKFVEIKPHLAVGMSTAADNYSDVIPGLTDLQMSPGVLIRPGIDVMFSISNSVAVATGLNFGINNSRSSLSIINESASNISTAYIKNHFYEISAPVYVSLRFNLGRRIRFNFDIGAYITQGLGGKVHTSGYTFGENSLGQPTISHLFYKKDYYDDDMSVINSVKKFDYGPHVAAGVIYRRHYAFNWVFEVSAGNLAINHNVLDVKYRHVRLAFEMGYIF